MERFSRSLLFAGGVIILSAAYSFFNSDVVVTDNPLVTSSVLFISAIVIGFFAIRAYREWSLIKDVPRSKVRSAAAGLVELHGVSRIASPIQAPITGEDCVLWKYSIEEYRKSVSGKGNSWQEVYSRTSSESFYLQDETGLMAIIPTHAQLEFSKTKTYYSSIGVFKKNTVELGAETLSDVSTSSLGKTRKHHLSIIKENVPFFVLGTALPHKDGLYVSRGENIKTFIISDCTENSLLKKLRNRFAILGLGSALMLVFSVAIVIGVV